VNSTPQGLEPAAVMEVDPLAACEKSWKLSEIEIVKYLSSIVLGILYIWILNLGNLWGLMHERLSNRQHLAVISEGSRHLAFDLFMTVAGRKISCKSVLDLR
jgi:hypothetical protein